MTHAEGESGSNGGWPTDPNSTEPSSSSETASSSSPAEGSGTDGGSGTPAEGSQQVVSAPGSSVTNSDGVTLSQPADAGKPAESQYPEGVETFQNGAYPGAEKTTPLPVTKDPETGDPRQRGETPVVVEEKKDEPAS